MKIVIVGAGIWGASTAFFLQKQGHKVQLFDMWGPGNVISGSGGVSRVIRLTYGADKIYTDLTFRSFELWQEIFGEQLAKHYQKTGMLWLFPNQNADYVTNSARRIGEHGQQIDEIDLPTAAMRYPQISWEGVSRVFLEPQAGILAASQCCQSLVEKFMEMGGKYRRGSVSIEDPAAAQVTIDGMPVHADQYIFAAGPWTRKLFPGVLTQCTYVSKQDVYHFSIPKPYLKAFSPPTLPMWLEYDPDSPLYYGMPMHLGKGFKIAYDDRGETFDPDVDDRTISPARLQEAKAFVRKRFPALKASPLVYSEVCQYDNSLDGHFIIDQHPGQEKFILLCGSSGHGFKMGPAVGELVSNHLGKGHSLPEEFKLKRFIQESTRQSQFLPKK